MVFDLICGANGCSGELVGVWNVIYETLMGDLKIPNTSEFKDYLPSKQATRLYSDEGPPCDLNRSYTLKSSPPSLPFPSPPTPLTLSQIPNPNPIPLPIPSPKKEAPPSSSTNSQCAPPSPFPFPFPFPSLFFLPSQHPPPQKPPSPAPLPAPLPTVNQSN